VTRALGNDFGYTDSEESTTDTTRWWIILAGTWNWLLTMPSRVTRFREFNDVPKRYIA